MDPLEYLRAIRRRWMVVAAAVAVALAAALAVAVLTPKPKQGTASAINYRASTLILNTGSDAFPGVGNLRTLATLVRVGDVPARVAAAVKFAGDPIDLAARITADVDRETGLLQISATSQDAGEAKTLADTFALELLAFIGDKQAEDVARDTQALNERINRLAAEIVDLDGRIGSSTSTQAQIMRAERDAKINQLRLAQEQYQRVAQQPLATSSLRVIQKARPVPLAAPTGAVRGPTSTLGRLSLAGILGLFLGVGMALVLERIDTRIRTKQGAEFHFGLPVLSEVPYIPRRARKEDEILVTAHPRSVWADSFRLLAAGVSRKLTLDAGEAEEAEAARAKVAPALHVARPGPRAGTPAAPAPGGQTILVTSPGPSEGKTTVVANLAAAFAERGKRVLIISCDFRRPRIHDVLGVGNLSGLANALRSKGGESLLEGNVRETLVRDVKVVPSGPVPDKPSELLGSANMRRALAEARRLADVVIIDTAPVFSSDAAHLLPEVEAVLLVARVGKTRAEQAERASEVLQRLGAPVVGLALNGTDDGTYYRSHYRYHAGPEDGGRKPLAGLARPFKG